jgi:hypothetical protein
VRLAADDFLLPDNECLIRRGRVGHRSRPPNTPPAHSLESQGMHKSAGLSFVLLGIVFLVMGFYYHTGFVGIGAAFLVIGLAKQRRASRKT